MPSQVFALFQSAIANRQQIVCDYHGYPREVCPHSVGYGKDGNEQALTFQFAGRSSKGLPRGGEWRCLDLRDVRNAIARNGPWHTNSDHSRRQSCVVREIASVF